MSARMWLAVGCGGALGALARALVSLGMLHWAGPEFGWGTLLANIGGSFLIALYAALSGPGGRIAPSPAQTQFVMAGFCGGFTTFSIFSLETVLLVQQGNPALAGAAVAGSVAAWLAAAAAGLALGARLNRCPA